MENEIIKNNSNIENENICVIGFLGINETRYINNYKILDFEEFKEYSDAIHYLWKFYNEQLWFFNKVTGNYQLLLKFLNENKNFEQPFLLIGSENISGEINILLFNVLSLAKAFLDHYSRKIKHEYSEEEYSHFIKRIKEFYDGCFSYRFIYKYRNYIQHIDFTKGFSRHVEGEKITTEITVNSIILLKEYKEWGPRIKEELEAKKNTFDLLPHLKEYISCLNELNLLKIRDIKEVERNIQKIENIYNAPEIDKNCHIIAACKDKNMLHYSAIEIEKLKSILETIKAYNEII